MALGEDGTPYFCGDAIADPLTGLVAAELARSAPDGRLFDLAMADVVASTVDSTLPGGAWSGAFARPRRRTAVGTAPAGGEHTGEVLRELGIR